MTLLERRPPNDVALVTGGAGFLGSHLCERLVKRGAHVVCVDDLSTGSRDNLEGLLGSPHFELLQHDVTAPLDVDAGQIWNLACPASPLHYQRDPVQTTKTCVLGALHMLDLARRHSARILQASTSEVYGDPDVHPQSEAYWGRVNPIGPRSCYDEGKRCAETLFFDYERSYGVGVKVVRIFNTYGPRMRPDDGRVISNFITQALAGEDLTIYGDGLQTRSFCYVDDVIDGIVRMMGSARGVIGPINLGTPQELTLLELADKVQRAVGRASRLVHKPLPPDDPRRRRPDITLARDRLGWEPHVTLDDGLKETVRYFRSLR